MMNQTNSGFLNSIPPVTKNLIIINLLFWVASLALPKVGVDLVDLLGFTSRVLPTSRLIRSFLICSCTIPIRSRMCFLICSPFICSARVLENVWGPKRFLIFYFVTGIGAGLVQEVVWFFNLRDVIFASQDMINLNGAQIISKSEFLNYFVTIGASGAVFGILLAFAMIFPNVPLYLMFIPIPIKAKYFVIFYGLAELFMGVASFGGDTVAHFAHLGGMLFGYFLIRYWKKKDADNGRYFY